MAVGVERRSAKPEERQRPEAMASQMCVCVPGIAFFNFSWASSNGGCGRAGERRECWAPRELRVNGGKVKAGSGQKVVSVDHRENSRVNGGRVEVASGPTEDPEARAASVEPSSELKG